MLPAYLGGAGVPLLVPAQGRLASPLRRRRFDPSHEESEAAIKFRVKPVSHSGALDDQRCTAHEQRGQAGDRRWLSGPRHMAS